MDSQTWGLIVWGLKDSVFVLVSLIFLSMSSFQNIPCVFLGKLWHILRKQTYKLIAVVSFPWVRGSGQRDVTKEMLTRGLMTSQHSVGNITVELKFWDLNFFSCRRSLRSKVRACSALHLNTRVCGCAYTLHTQTHLQKLLSVKIKEKDLFLPKLLQFQHLPVWVSLTRIISFVLSYLFIFFPLKHRNFTRSVFKSVSWQVYTCRPQPGSKQHSS